MTDLENFKKQEKAEAIPSGGIEEKKGPLEIAEIKEAQENLQKINQLEDPNEKLKFIDKLKTGLKKVGNVSLMVGGSLVAISGLALLGVETSHINFTEGLELDVDPSKILSDLNATLFMFGQGAFALGGLLGMKGAANMEKLNNRKNLS